MLFPAYRRHFPDGGDDLTAHIEGDHQVVNDLLQELQRADPTSAEYDATVRRAFAAIDDDARHEEDVLLPMLQQVAGAEQLRVIGAAWEAARLASPTRPHPKISRRPPGNALAALGLSVSDRVEDAVDALAPPGTAARAALAGVVAGAAGVAVMTLGEQVEQALPPGRSQRRPAHDLVHRAQAAPAQARVGAQRAHAGARRARTRFGVTAWDVGRSHAQRLLLTSGPAGRQIRRSHNRRGGERRW